MGDRMDNIHPGAMPWLHRYVGNPVLTGVLNVFFRTGVERRALRHARAAARRAAAARPAHDRHGVRLRDGDPGRRRRSSTSASSRSSTTRAAARASCRASATAGATCASCSSTARRTCSCCPGAIMLVARRARSRSIVAAADRRLRPRVGPAHDGRRRAADDRRHAGRRARPVRARLRHVLHGREGPVVRPHARALPARARAAARRRDRCSPGSSIGRGHRRASGSTAASAQLSEERLAVLARGARHRRHPDLLHVVPALASSACAGAAELPPPGVFATSVGRGRGCVGRPPARCSASPRSASACWSSALLRLRLQRGGAAAARRRARACAACSPSTSSAATAGWPRPCSRPPRSPASCSRRGELRERLRPGPRAPWRGRSSRCSTSRPSVLSGHWTWYGYNFLNDTAVQFMLADALQHHGARRRRGPRVDARRERSEAYLESGYPLGTHAQVATFATLAAGRASTSSTRATWRCSRPPPRWR